MLRSWLPSVLLSALIAVLFAVACVVILVDMRAQARPATPMTVAEVMAHFEAGGGTLAHVRLTDLVVDCRANLRANRWPYVLAHTDESHFSTDSPPDFSTGSPPDFSTGSPPDFEQVLIELDDDTNCHPLAASTAGSVHRGSPELWLSTGAMDGTPLLRPLNRMGWALAICIAFTALSIILMIEDFHAPRQEAAQLANLMRAPAAATPVNSPTGPGGAYRSGEPDRFLLQRPILLSARWRRQALWVTGAVITAGTCVAIPFGIWLTRLLHAQSLWERGETASDVELHVTKKKNLLLSSHDITFSFTDGRGQPRFGTYQHSALLWSVDPKDSSLTIRYDPADPDDAVPALVIDNLQGEWLAFGLLALIASGLACAIGSGLRPERALRRRIREMIFAGPEEVILSIRASERSGSGMRYVFTTPEGHSIDGVFTASHLPFHLKPFGPDVLALRHPHDPLMVVVLRHDLWPLAVDEGEVARVRGRYRLMPVATKVRAPGHRRRRGRPRS